MNGALRPGFGQLIRPKVVRNLLGERQQPLLDVLLEHRLVVIEPCLDLTPRITAVPHIENQLVFVASFEPDSDRHEPGSEVSLQPPHNLGESFVTAHGSMLPRSAM